MVFHSIDDGNQIDQIKSNKITNTGKPSKIHFLSYWASFLSKPLRAHEHDGLLLSVIDDGDLDGLDGMEISICLSTWIYLIGTSINLNRLETHGIPSTLNLIESKVFSRSEENWFLGWLLHGLTM